MRSAWIAWIIFWMTLAAPFIVIAVALIIVAGINRAVWDSLWEVPFKDDEITRATRHIT